MPGMAGFVSTYRRRVRYVHCVLSVLR